MQNDDCGVHQSRTWFHWIAFEFLIEIGIILWVKMIRLHLRLPFRILFGLLTNIECKMLETKPLLRRFLIRRRCLNAGPLLLHLIFEFKYVLHTLLEILPIALRHVWIMPRA